MTELSGTAGQAAGQRIIVDADQCHLLRHGNPGGQAGLQQLAGAGVADGDDADGFGQALQPGDQLFDGAVPQRCAGAHAAIDFAVQAVAFHQFAKGFFALLRPAIGLRFRQAEAGKTLQSRLDQMRVGQRYQRVVIGGDVGNRFRIGALILVRAPYRYHWHLDIGQRLANQRIVEVGNDPVALPALDAFQATEKILLEKQVPGGTGAAQVVADAADDATVVDLAAVEQQGDAVNRRYGFHCFYACPRPLVTGGGWHRLGAWPKKLNTQNRTPC